MNASRFAAFAQLLTAGTTRRGISHSLAGLALGGILGAQSGLGEAEGRRHKNATRSEKFKTPRHLRGV